MCSTRGGLALHAIFDVNLWMAICLLATVAGVYTIVGGLAAVVWTDILQAILLLGGGLLVFVLGVQEVEGGWEAIRGIGERAHLILPADHPELPWTGMLVLIFSTNIWYYSTNQYINQRVLGAKNEWHARAGMLFTAFLGLFLALAVCFPGMIARQLFPELADPDQAYPVVVSRLIGPLGYGIRGLVFAGLIGAIMSTIDSLVNSTSTILTLDVVKRFWRRDLSDAQIIRWGRVMSGIVAGGGGGLDARGRSMGLDLQLLPGLLGLSGGPPLRWSSWRRCSGDDPTPPRPRSPCSSAPP